MNLEEIKKAAKKLALEWPTLDWCDDDDKTDWALVVIWDVLVPLCEGDPEVENAVKKGIEYLTWQRAGEWEVDD